MTKSMPPASGQRMKWDQVSASLKAELEEHFGARVIRAETQSSGFSPGIASKLLLSNNQCIFVKAVTSTPNHRTPEIHRQEIKIASQLPQVLEVPKLLWSFDKDEWVALAFEFIEGKLPDVPWREDELQIVLSAFTRLSDVLTPSPLRQAPSVQELFEKSFNKWRLLLRSKQEKSWAQWLDPWCARNLEKLADLEDGWESFTRGKTLLHADIRADNILITKEKKVVFVDWPWASVGAKWLDLLFFLPSLAMQKGPKPWQVFDSHDLTKDADPNAVTKMVCALAGLFLFLANQPPEPGLPTLRPFQLGQGLEALEWLKKRTAWE